MNDEEIKAKSDEIIRLCLGNRIKSIYSFLAHFDSCKEAGGLWIQ